MTHKWEKTSSGFRQEPVEVALCGLVIPIKEDTPTQTRMRWENVTCKKCLSKRDSVER